LRLQYRLHWLQVTQDASRARYDRNKVCHPMTKRNRIDQLLAAEMSGSDKLTAALKARGFTLSGFARHIGHWPEEVRMTVRGIRTYPVIRDAIATELGISREEVDALID